MKKYEPPFCDTGIFCRTKRPMPTAGLSPQHHIFEVVYPIAVKISCMISENGGSDEDANLKSWLWPAWIMTGDYGLTIKLSKRNMKDHIKYLIKTVIIVCCICTQIQLQSPWPFLLVQLFMLLFIDRPKFILINNQFRIGAALFDNRG